MAARELVTSAEGGLDVSEFFIPFRVEVFFFFTWRAIFLNIDMIQELLWILKYFLVFMFINSS